MSRTIIEDRGRQDRGENRQGLIYPPGSPLSHCVGFTAYDRRPVVCFALIGSGVIRPSLDHRLRLEPRILDSWFFSAPEHHKQDALGVVMEELLVTPEVVEHFYDGDLRIYCSVLPQDRELVYGAFLNLEMELYSVFTDARGWDISFRHWPAD